MAQSNMEDVPDFLSMDTNLSLEDYFATSNCGNDVGSNISDEPWKEFSDGSDSGIDSKYIGMYVVYIQSFISGMHHCECVAPIIGISLWSGQF